MTLLRELGVDPQREELRRVVALVRDHCRWEHAAQRFFDGEVEPCINGRTVALGVYFDQDVEGVVSRLLGEQLADGGWNCEAERGSVRSSFDTTINVLEGLLAHERATGGSARSIAARRRGEEYLLERRLFRRKSTGAVVDPAYLDFSFPTRWHYDMLRALEYFRVAGDPPTSGSTKRSSCSDPSSSPTAPGCWSTRIPARSISRSRRAMASRVGGTRSGRCACCAGPGSRLAEDELGSQLSGAARIRALRHPRRRGAGRPRRTQASRRDRSTRHSPGRWRE